MALRMIREEGDECLRCVCKEITEITPRILELIEDLKDTMYDADGVGLAAPQVGVRKPRSAYQPRSGLFGRRADRKRRMSVSTRQMRSGYKTDEG